VKLCPVCRHRFTTAGWRCPACAHTPQAVDGFTAFAPGLAETSDGFEARYFNHLVTLEATHFWFRARNDLIRWARARYFPAARSLLEVGCGAGQVLAAIRNAFPGLVLAGSEVHTAGLVHAAARLPGVTLLQMDARAMPFQEEFDVVAAFDVLEHVTEDSLVLAEMARAVIRGGGLLITVPQHPSLWGPTDNYARHKRRYTRSALLEKLVAAGFRPLRTTFFVSLLFPLLVASRWWTCRRPAPFDPLGEFRTSQRVGCLLEALMRLERRLIAAGVSFPLGGSLLVVARRA
jgi:SAM-dependent methyltransferase